MEAFTAKGVNGQLTVYPNKIVISRKGFLAVLGHGLKGDKEIALQHITSIQFKNAGPVFNGYIQFVFPGSQENKGGIWDATKDENTVMFNIWQQKDFLEARELIEQYRHRLLSSQDSGQTSMADELARLASLRERGVITEEEFQAAKKRIFGV